MAVKWFTETNGTTIAQIPKGAAAFVFLADGTVEEHIPDIEDVSDEADIPDHIVLARTVSYFLQSDDLVDDTLERMIEEASGLDVEELDFEEEEEEEEDENEE